MALAEDPDLASEPALLMEPTGGAAFNNQQGCRYVSKYSMSSLGFLWDMCIYI